MGSDARTYRLAGLALAVAGGLSIALGYPVAGVVLVAGAVVMIALSNRRR
jgi:hypothetical protein